MPKRTGKRKNSESDEQEVEDIMAWGNRKENYYQDNQNQYSELSEEEEEAKKIYENQLEQLGNQHFYQLPQEQKLSEQQDEEQGQTQNQLSHDYLTRQIKNMAKLGIKISMESNSPVKTLLESHIQTYLMSIIALRELTIPHLQYHPILNQIMQMKEDINNLKALLQTSTHHEEYQNQQEESFNQDDEEQAQGLQGNEDEEVSPQQELNQGLRIYQQEKNKQEQIKKQKKEQKKIERLKNQKPTFAKVKQNQGRLANEKILKNKGLMKKRKKIDRNSRVKHRRKFQKATSKRRAYGHVIRENPGRQYQGERNIKFGRIASTKLK